MTRNNLMKDKFRREKRGASNHTRIVLLCGTPRELGHGRTDKKVMREKKCELTENGETENKEI